MEAALDVDARASGTPGRPIFGIENDRTWVRRRMTDRPAEKPTDEWITGDEPMTGPQQSYLETLAREAGEDVPDDLTKAQASEMIERLQAATGRGASEPA